MEKLTMTELRPHAKALGVKFVARKTEDVLTEVLDKIEDLYGAAKEKGEKEFESFKEAYAAQLTFHKEAKAFESGGESKEKEEEAASAGEKKEEKKEKKPAEEKKEKADLKKAREEAAAAKKKAGKEKVKREVAKGQRKPGVIAEIVTIMRSTKKGFKREQILDRLQKKFPDRAAESMTKTIAHVTKGRFKEAKAGAMKVVEDNGHYRVVDA